MNGTFGARLRQRREEQGIDLIAIAAQTKIKMSLLEALERDDVAQWPAGIFRRAYIRAYAQSIDLDPDAVLREFLDVYPEPPEVVTTEAIASAVDSRFHTGPPTRLRYIVGSAFSSLAKLRRSSGEAMPQPASSRPDDRSPDRSAERKPIQRVEPTVTSTATDDVAAGAYEPLVEFGDVLMSEPLVAEATDVEPLAEASEEAAEENAVVRQDHAQIAAQGDSTLEPLEGPTLSSAVASPERPRERRKIDFSVLAQVCTGFGQVQSAADLSPLLREAARLLGAPGLILWIWDPSADGLRAALAYGYSDRVLAQFPVVEREADNATAAAFRRGQTCRTSGNEHTNSAIVVPLLTADGCAGVLAVELPYTREHDGAVQAAATILAAMLAQLAAAPVPADEGSDFDGSVEDVSPARASAAR